MTTLTPSDRTDEADTFSRAELQQATRNHGMHLEGLRYDLTPSGMHYLLVHFDVPEVDPATWRLEIGGAVDRPLSLSLDDLRQRPSRTLAVTMECAGNGRTRMSPRAFSQPWVLEAVGTAEWTGVPLADVLADVGIRPEAVDLVFTGADHGIQGDVEHDYARSLTPADASRPEVMLAYAMNGRPLDPQHGAPVRLLVPGWYGMTSVKWLTRIEAVTTPFDGYQQAVAYRYQADEDDDGVPVQRIRVRALMVPPGHPDFPERNRYVEAGPVTVRGRAWCGSAPVARVDVGVDGAWQQADLGPSLGDFAWRGWFFTWEATPGRHVLSCRATDADGNTQPEQVEWNVQGMGNNLVQEVDVSVR